MSDTDIIEKQLADMARLTVLSNKINPIQEKNMTMFPMVYFNGVKTVKIDYDLSKTKVVGDGPEMNNSIVSYYLTMSPDSENDYLEKRFAHLENSIRNLFWKEVVLEVYFNDKIVYKSKKL